MTGRQLPGGLPPLSLERQEPDPLMPPEELAELLGVTPRNLADWRRKGKGPRPTWLAKRRAWYLTSDVVRWLDNTSPGWWVF